MKKKIIKSIVLVLLLLIYIVSICEIELQNDTLFDIKCGELFFNEGIVKTDTFSIHEGLKYQSHHIVPTIILYVIYNYLGFLGLYIFQILLTIIIAGLMYKLNKQLTRDRFYSYLLVFVELYFMKGFISLRAQMFSSIIFLSQLVLINELKKCDKFTKGKGLAISIALGIIPFVLINFHSGVYPFYYIIMGVYFVGSCVRKEIKFSNSLLIISVISVPFMVINPYLLDGLTYVFKTLSNDFMANNVSEFAPLSLREFPVTVATIALVGSIFIMSKRKKNLEEILFFLGTTFMTMLSIRHFIFFAICSPVILTSLYEGWSNIKNDEFEKQTKLVAKVVTLFAYAMIILGFMANKSYDFLGSDELFPKEAVNYIKENLPSDARILNEYNYGSYMMFNDIKTFVDARADLFTEEYNNVTIAQDGANFCNCNTYYMDIIEKYDIEYVFVSKDKNVVKYLEYDINMELLFENENSVIYKVNG